MAALPLLVAGLVALAGLPGAAGCLGRDVVSSSPTTTTLFTRTVRSQAIDKIDLLFVIDNSASMGDKQDYLRKAVPDLLTRLVAPNCVDSTTNQVYGPADSKGECAKGGVEFPPVHDLHVGIVSTSLGPRLANDYQIPESKTPFQYKKLCDPGETVTLASGVTVSKHNDDRGELLNRGGPAETPIADLGTSSYLNWFPDVPANAGRTPSPGAPPISDANRLKADFALMVDGVGTFGCAIESQLESWYRFLVQPDPYDSLALDAHGSATWSGVDATILKQRHDFLRPDSLVAIVDLTDENDSEIDVRSFGGSGYMMMSTGYDPFRGTSGCAENAAGSGLVDPSSCRSCADEVQDPNCSPSPIYTDANDWGYNVNLRHVRMMQKYGLWPQYPIERYALGLSSPKVPDRQGEYPASGNYQGLENLDCTNPLFAEDLPDGSDVAPSTLCHLKPGPRTKDLVYYAHIGGVPHQLLQRDPQDPDSPQKESLTPADWVKILGKDSERQDFTGADPHMIESYKPRPGLPAPTSPPPGGNPDPISGREWVTHEGTGHILAVDREYACTFDLTTPRDCSQTSDPFLVTSCDCPGSGAALTYEQLPPICDPAQPSRQTGAKAYPTVRELLVAKLLGAQGIVSSLCPIHVVPDHGDSPPDPLWGYRPAMNAIANRLGLALIGQCTNQKLVADECGRVQCLIMATLPGGTESDCAAQPGMSVPSDDVLATFRRQQHREWTVAGASGSDPSALPTCEVKQLARLAPGAAATCGTGALDSDFDAKGSCLNSREPGWCYQTGVSGCPQGSQQRILFSRGLPPSGVTVSLQCFEQGATVVRSAQDAGD